MGHANPDDGFDAVRDHSCSVPNNRRAPIMPAKDNLLVTISIEDRLNIANQLRHGIMDGIERRG